MKNTKNNPSNETTTEEQAVIRNTELLSLSSRLVDAYKVNPINLDNNKKIRKVTLLQMKSIVATLEQGLVITKDEVITMESCLHDDFKDAGLHGGGHQINSALLTEIRSMIKTKLDGAVDNKNVFYRDWEYHNLTDSGKVAVIECNVIVKHLTTSQLYKNTSTEVDLKDGKKQVLNNVYKEHFKIIQPEAKAAQATTKK